MLTPNTWRKSSYSGGDEGDACVEVARLESWKKSSFSGGGDGNTCVEVATLDPHIAIRDSKAPTLGTLTFPPTAFTPFIESLKFDGSARS
ncbi:DUF397 domain-containing protein [Streptomyces camelliae]|uniref:DUF397 domain-containing protein n=1 Tax=Streptomyces camelliae TaxID=3004093 RepID=A0ABY7P2Y3_9ACTN|nr:DUF397 domain-containing protein [Streptomyces sp. HUAS 2-6]WBO64067.1 DUF397 domain-containing protein [Streptomyces sp. HUAS 2-6]